MNKKIELYKLNRYIDRIYPHFDRVVFDADSDISFISKKSLTNFDAKGRKPKFVKKSKHSKSQYKYNITIYQPSKENILHLVNTMAEKHINIHCSAIEVTFDFTCVNSTPADIAAIMDQYLVQPRKKSKNSNGSYFHMNEKRNCYWGTRNENKDIKNRKHNFFHLSYHDRKSKILHEPCYHFETKIYSKSQCAEYNLGLPSDLLDFNFAEFYKANTQFYVYPSKYVIGLAQALTYNHKEDLSKRNYEKIATTFLDKKLPNMPKPPVQYLLVAIPTLKTILAKYKSKKKNDRFQAMMQELIISKFYNTTLV